MNRQNVTDAIYSTLANEPFFGMLPDGWEIIVCSLDTATKPILHSNDEKRHIREILASRVIWGNGND